MLRFRTLRLMADDMTGALDSAAGLVGVFGPLRVGIDAAENGACVIDMATRETTADVAAVRVAGCAAHLSAAPDRLCFFKVDSLLRGNAAVELAALLAVKPFERVIIAPAMPFQGRVTQGGRQHTCEGTVWRATGEDLGARLGMLGQNVHLVARGNALPPGLALCDAESDADLDAIVQAGLQGTGPTLWVGAGGLAAALARALGGQMMTQPELAGPILGLVGSHHRVMREQLARVEPVAMTIEDGGAASAQRVQGLLGRSGAAFLQVALPEAYARDAAEMRIAEVFADLVVRMPRPGLLFVSGGETLRALLSPLGADGLNVLGEFEPGAPVSRLCGGAWDGMSVLSKSGAFGTPDFLERLMTSLNHAKVRTA